MQILYHEDDAQVEVASSVDQYKGYLSAERGGVKIPLEYDYVDFVGCDGIATTSAIINISGDVFRYPNGHLVKAKASIEGEDAPSIDIGIYEDDNQVTVKSSVDQFNGMFSAEVGGVRRPIEYDNVNYVGCGEVNSTSSIIDIDDTSGFVKPDGHYVEANQIVTGSDADAMGVLMHEDKASVRALSSIDQFSHFLADYRGGEWLPIEFDAIDYISCDKVESRSIIVDNGNNIGYYFEVGERQFVFDEYPLFNHTSIEEKPLPEWMGEGTHKSYEDHDSIANFDNASLGTRNWQTIRIGQDYYLADEILPAEDFE